MQEQPKPEFQSDDNEVKFGNWLSNQILTAAKDIESRPETLRGPFNYYEEDLLQKLQTK